MISERLMIYLFSVKKAHIKYDSNSEKNICIEKRFFKSSMGSEYSEK